MRHLKFLTSLLSISFTFFCPIENVFCQSGKQEMKYILNQEYQYLEELQTKMDEFFLRNPDKKNEKQWRRREYFAERHLDQNGRIVDYISKSRAALNNIQRKNSNSRSTHGKWTYLGHTSSTNRFNSGQGRINRIDIHPADPNTIFVSCSSGGLWKTTNGGTSWSNLTPNIPYISITDIEIHPTNHNIIYALLGDGNLSAWTIKSHSQSGHPNSGIIKSTDGGLTWEETGYTFDKVDGFFAYKLVIHPTIPDIQFCLTSDGVRVTQNDWDSYGILYDIGRIPVYDLEHHPTNPNIRYYATADNIFKSTSILQANAIIDPDFDFGGCTRIDIAVSPDFPSLVYVLANCIGKDRLYSSLLSGNDNSWVIKDTVSNHIGPYEIYTMGFGANDLNYRHLIAGGIGMFKSTNQGSPGWDTITDVHIDLHDVLWKNGILYLATDGGIYKSTNGGNSFTDLSAGLAINEVYTITGTPTDVNKYIIGSQDIGHHMRESNNSHFRTIGCCDGMISIIDHSNTNTIYIAGQNGGINKSTDNGFHYISTNNPGDGGAWNTPYIMDPFLSSTLFVGKDSVHRTDNSGMNWQYIGSPSSGNLNVLRQGINNRNILYASDGGKLWITYNALTPSGVPVWHDISPPPNMGLISDIAVHPLNAYIIYVSFASYSAEGSNKVFKGVRVSTSDFTWEDISGGIPDVPVLTVEFHNTGLNDEALYIGTDIGVFHRNNSLGEWIYFSNGLPVIPVTDLYINTTNSTLAAGTYGRGLWRSSLYSGCQNNITIAGGTFPNAGVLKYAASSTISSNKNYVSNNWTKVDYRAGNYIDFLIGFEMKQGSLLNASIGNCPLEEDPLLSQKVFPKGILNSNEIRNE